MDRLRNILGITFQDFLRVFPVRENVYPDAMNGPNQAVRLRLDMRGVVFVLGRQAWRELGFGESDWFSRYETPVATWVLLPHPSGRSLTLNDDKMRRRVRREVYQWLKSK